MANRDRPAHDVDDVLVDLPALRGEPLEVREHLRGERLVELDQAKILPLNAGALELAAVTLPYRRSNTGFSLAIWSSEVSARTPLSCVTTESPDRAGNQGAISAVRRPSAVPLAAS